MQNTVISILFEFFFLMATVGALLYIYGVSLKIYQYKTSGVGSLFCCYHFSNKHFLATIINYLYQEKKILYKEHALLFRIQPYFLFIISLLPIVFFPILNNIYESKGMNLLLYEKSLYSLYGVFILIYLYPLSILLINLTSKDRKNVYIGLSEGSKLIFYLAPMLIIILSISILGQSSNLEEVIKTQYYFIDSNKGMWGVIERPISAVVFIFCMMTQGDIFCFSDKNLMGQVLKNKGNQFTGVDQLFYKASRSIHSIIWILLFVYLFLGGRDNFIGTNHLYFEGWGADITTHFSSLFFKCWLVMLLCLLLRWLIYSFKEAEYIEKAWKILLFISIIDLSFGLLLTHWRY